MPTILRLSGRVCVYMCVCVCVCVCVKRIGIFRLSFVTDFGRWVVVGVEEG